MALTPAQLRQRDAQRRADHLPPGPEPPGGAPTPWWRGAVATREDLPLGGNARGDVILVMDDDTVDGGLARWWDGTDWLPLAGGGDGGPAEDTYFIELDWEGPFTEGMSPILGSDGKWRAGELTPQ